MTGSLRLYMILILTAIISITAGTILATEGFNFNIDDLAPITAPEVIVAVIMAVAAIGTTIAKNRIAAILILGVVGYGLSILFVMYRAPDLALTQLIVETVTVVLFLLCFYHLPNLKADTNHLLKEVRMYLYLLLTEF